MYATPDCRLPIGAGWEWDEHQLEFLLLRQRFYTGDDAPGVDHGHLLLQEGSFQVHRAGAAAGKSIAALHQSQEGIEGIDGILRIDGYLRFIALIIEVISPGFGHSVGAIGAEAHSIHVSRAVAVTIHGRLLGSLLELIPRPGIIRRLGQQTFCPSFPYQVNIDSQMIGLGNIRPEPLLAI